MQEVYDEVLSSGRKQRAIPEKVVLELLKAEAAERRLRSIRYRLGQARFPMLKDLDSFRFADSGIDEAQIRSLYEGGFLEEHSNLIFVGGTGTGNASGHRHRGQSRAPRVTSSFLQPGGFG